MTLVLKGVADFIDKYDRMKITYFEDSTKKILMALNNKECPLSLTKDGFFMSCKKLKCPKSLLGQYLEITCTLYEWSQPNKRGTAIIATDIRVIGPVADQ